MPPSADLLEAYRRTEYRVDDRGWAFVLRIDEPSESLSACHEALGVSCSTFITAWNPRSEPAPSADNAAAMRRLMADLEARGLPRLRGIGIDPSGEWPGEESVLVPGLGRDEDVARARTYRQLAIVCAGDDATPRLVMT